MAVHDRVAKGGVVRWFAGILAVIALHVSGPPAAHVTANATGCGSVAVIGHRGEPQSRPEETLPSFQQAIADGARTIEMDVQFTSDNVPVLMHDLTVDRTTDGTGPLRSYSAARIAQLDAGSWFGATWTGTRVPTFDAVLALAAAHHVAVIAELKDPATTDANITAYLASLSRSSAPVLVESFYPNLLQEMAARSPSTPTALITSANVTPATAAQYGRVLIVSQTVVTSTTVAGWHAAGLKVYAWTPDSAVQWSAMRQAGADAVMTDDTHGFFASCSRGSPLPPGRH
jgi:glycerophosphoryl diester phosphodiesterase